jgi:hypothetical protein
VVMNPAGLGPENESAAEDQQQLQTTDTSSSQRGCYVRTITASVQSGNKLTGRESQEVVAKMK